MIYSWFQQTRTTCYKGLKVLKLSLSVNIVCISCQYTKQKGKGIILGK